MEQGLLQSDRVIIPFISLGKARAAYAFAVVNRTSSTLPTQRK